MTWQLSHHFVGMTCDRAMRLSRFGRAKRPTCPHVGGAGVGEAIADSITALLLRRGIDYPPAAGGNTWLWCLGGPDLYRRPLPADFDEQNLGAETCLDLNLYVCDRHKIVSLELFPFDLVPEYGGSGPGNPRQSTPIGLGADAAAVAGLLERAEPWLDEILEFPIGKASS
ncbi:MAG: hypothetical protein ACR2P0_17660 [Acidimicrobiales bacterium]